MLAEIVKTQETITFERAHFSGIGPSSMNFEVVYWVETADYIRFMDIQQEIYLQLVERLAEQDIRLALPAQTLHLQDARAAVDEDKDEDRGAPPAPAQA
jgi:small-conductance mechanosensitive channel